MYAVVPIWLHPVFEDISWRPRVYVKVWPFHTFSLYELSYYINLKHYTIKLMEFNIPIHHNEIKRDVFGKR
jgi:hypothetical protein